MQSRAWLCLYSAPTVHMPGVCSVAYGAVHYEETLNMLRSFDESDVKQY